MTLNITVATPRRIYQSADYRLLDWTTKKLTDFETQKIFLVTKSEWMATVCFAGIGRTPRVNVGDWVAERLGEISHEEPFEILLELLKKADEWIADVQPPHNMHTFSIGAFVRSDPIFALVSNFEAVGQKPLEIPLQYLSVSTTKPVSTKVFASGQVQAVTRLERKQLTGMAKSTSDVQLMHAALAKINKAVSTRTQFVSAACFTTHLSLTGQGSGVIHGLEKRPFAPNLGLPAEAHEAIQQLLVKQFGPRGGTIVQTAVARTVQSDEEFQIQLREKPNDAEIHNNYGAFLHNQKGDASGAEREYRRAVEINPNFALALGNLAHVCRMKGDLQEAEELYKRAFKHGNHDVMTIARYADFLAFTRQDAPQAVNVALQGIEANPQSGYLYVTLGEIQLSQGKGAEALAAFQNARNNHGDQKATEIGFAQALHMSGASTSECIAAYRTALSVGPEYASLRLNLAQLLFIKGDITEAKGELNKALQSKLDDSDLLEASFYQLAHLKTDAEKVMQEILGCLKRGARLRWNVQQNIEKIRKGNAKKATVLERLRDIMSGNSNNADFGTILSDWKSS